MELVPPGAQQRRQRVKRARLFAPHQWVLDVVALEFLWAQADARGKDIYYYAGFKHHIYAIHDGTDRHGGISCEGVRFPGTYHSLGRGISTRLYKSDSSTQSLANVNVG